MRPALLYALHSGNLYGTERMGLVTLQGLRDTFDPVLLSPPGPALAEAERLGIATVPFQGVRQFIPALAKQLLPGRPVAFFATGVSHSLAFIGLNSLFRRPCRHIHLVHGGTDERLSYGRKKWLNGRAVTLVAVSDFVRERLLAHQVDARHIIVIENFLPDEQIAAAPYRPPFAGRGVSNVIIVSRVDPIKRIDLLLDALDAHPELRDLSYDVFGTGWDFDALCERATRDHPMVRFHGFSDRIPEAMAKADLLLHLCPEEPFGLAILEAMAARIPVMVPDRGGAATLIEPGVSGFRFAANDVNDLAHQMKALKRISAKQLNGIVSHASNRLASRYSSSARLADYRALLQNLSQ